MKKKLIEDNMKLVYFLVNKYYPTFSRDEDVIQCGMLGLCKAADTWDETKSEFSTYACKCILNEICTEFTRRKKHSNNLSLDYEVSGKDGEKVSFGALLVGEEDIGFTDYDSVDDFYDTLSDLDKDILMLRRAGLTTEEIGKRVGYAQTTISLKLRQLRNQWRKFNGN